MEQMGSASHTHKRRRLTPGTIRIALVFLALLAQLLLLAYLVGLLQQNAAYLYLLLEISGAAIVTFIATRNRNSSYAIMWLIIMMVLPVFGYLLFLLWGTTGLTHRKSQLIRNNIAYSQQFQLQDPQAYGEFSAAHPTRQKLGQYLKWEGFPIYGQTDCTYYPVGELQFKQLILDMEQAQEFIFLEYYIVADGLLWEEIHDILRRKAAQGLDIRLLFDDLGSIGKISDSLMDQLHRENIKVLNFNPVQTDIYRLLINYRNHQKIAVIDGNIGYTGGTNLADEYANITKDLGHWKDAALRMEGPAVWGLTTVFLQMWDAESGQRSDYELYRPSSAADKPGFYQPFADGPFNNPRNPALEIYLQIISGAQRYVYITTPYLVIDSTIKDILCMAAKGGIDVRIATPKRWDHWFVHMVTQSNYRELLEAGIRIYEYTPGFLHSKIILSDDDNGVISSINMDYRSFFLLFENGVWICGAPVLEDIKADLVDIFAVSEEIMLAEWRKRPRRMEILQYVLRVFAPLF